MCARATAGGFAPAPTHAPWIARAFTEPEGFAAYSRGLSTATPPETPTERFSILEGCQTWRSGKQGAVGAIPINDLTNPFLPQSVGGLT